MGITEDYREKVEDMESSVENMVSREDASRMKVVLDQMLPFALLSLVFVLIIGFVVPVNAQMVKAINYLNWAVIAYFAARLAVGLRLARSKKIFMEQHWLDFALVIPAFSLLQEVKILEMLGEFEVFSREGETVVGSVALTRTLGVASKLTRITRIIKRTVLG